MCVYIEVAWFMHANVGILSVHLFNKTVKVNVAFEGHSENAKCNDLYFFFYYNDRIREHYDLHRTDPVCFQGPYIRSLQF